MKQVRYHLWLGEGARDIVIIVFGRMVFGWMVGIRGHSLSPIIDC